MRCWSTLSPRKRTFSELIRVSRSLEPLGSRDLTAPGRLVEPRQRLRADERRGDQLVLGSDLDLAGRNPEQRVAVDDEESRRETLHASPLAIRVPLQVASGADDSPASINSRARS
jgi:hypothetical protein